MKLSLIEMEGFRGVRAHVRLNLPDGLLILTGRNGSGKSTICDAIEFALTGMLSKYEGSSERGESTDQYIWWRGGWPAAKNLVRIGLRDEYGNEILITRTPAGVEIDGASDIEGALCDLRLTSSNPLSQLCRTAIIRDEFIAALSIDLAEADRFSFVRTALGTDVLDEVVQRGKVIQAGLKKRVDVATIAYTRSREEVTSLLSQLSEARVGVTEVPDVAAAEATLRQMVGSEVTDPTQLLAIARQKIAGWRRLSDSLVRIAHDVQSVRSELTALTTEDSAITVREMEARRLDLESEIAKVNQELGDTHRQLHEEQGRTSLGTYLASLYDAGAAVGLIHDSCPLCGTKQSEDHFRAALAALSDELQSADRRIAALRTASAQQAARLATLRGDLQALDGQLRGIASRKEGLQRRLEQLAAEAGGRTAPEDTTSEALLARVRNGHERIELASAALSVLEASAAIERVAELERRLAQAREQSDNLDAALKLVQAAERRSKNLLASVRRTIGEISEERLAALEPLLKDLYSRLKPHTDWTDLNYRVRGDVKKFLSLRVGEDVNPRFTFSSGQRRAIGLAFLLAVHLSRPWCRLRTLVLDDPIQHIDDFRSLHLVEVLSAIRKAGQQVICAVEDEGLAELMARRVVQMGRGDAQIVRMAYQSGEGANIARSDAIVPPAKSVLLGA